MELEGGITRSKPLAVFMAFGTKGDVYPLAAIAAAFSCDQEQYNVFVITHSEHKNLCAHLDVEKVKCIFVSSPPVVSPYEDSYQGTVKSLFSEKKRIITNEHRRQIIASIEMIFGDGPSLEGDFIMINFFALEGWSIAEVYCIPCIIAAPYVIPYSAPSSFEQRFRKELPLLYQFLQEAPSNKIGWKDVMHWMWPLFTEHWGSWRSNELNLSPWPFTDPVTGLPTWHDRYQSPLLLYGFSREIVECPGYWPSKIRVCGFWFVPDGWLFSCSKCAEISAFDTFGNVIATEKVCLAHAKLLNFFKTPLHPPVFIGLSSAGSMGFLKNPLAFLHVLETVLKSSSYRFILSLSGCERLQFAIQNICDGTVTVSESKSSMEDGISLFEGRLFCFSGSVPYKWLFPRCATAVHHGGSGSIAAALHTGIPQVICPFILDQFYWAERMCWLGVAPDPLKRSHLIPEEDEDIFVVEAANVLLKAINKALSPEVKNRAKEIAHQLSHENGVLEAVRVIKEEMNL